MPSSTPVTLPPTAPRTAPPGVLPRRSCIFSRRGLRTSRKPATLAFTQPGRSTTSTGRVRGHVPSGPIRVKPADVLLGGLGVPAQLRDDRTGLVPAHLRSRPHEPGRGRHREIPVDHLGTTDARHASTVRGPPRRAGHGRPVREMSGSGPEPVRGDGAQRQPQPANAVAARSSAAWAAAGSVVPAAMKAKASSRPSWSTTVPARVLTPVRVPVLARTRPAAPRASGVAARRACR